MKALRLVTTVGVVSLLGILALFTESFWWFLQIDDWQAVFKDHGQGTGEMTTACLWAVIHGVLSVVGGYLFCLNRDVPFYSAKEYGLALLYYCALTAAFLSIVDLGSGWWMLVEGGRYIPLCYAAFLQPFLVGYLLLILCIPNPVKNKGARKLLRSVGKRASC